MSIKYGLLALLERGPMHGYQLRVAFEESTGGTWPLNLGQVYTTLSRLERDGLVRPLGPSDGGQRPYEITDAGHKDLAAWFATPVSRADRPRDELAIKLALALSWGSSRARSCTWSCLPRPRVNVQTAERRHAPRACMNPHRVTDSGEAREIVSD